MRLVILIGLALLAGWGLLKADQALIGNYAQVYVAGYLIEAKLVPLIVLTLFVVLAVYLLVHLTRLVLGAPKKMGRWSDERASHKADANLGDGYLALVKGDWSLAEKKLIAKADYARVPYVNYLAAAQAAQEQSNMAKRDEYLNLAYKAAPKERLAIGLTKARLHFNAGQYEQADATLQDIASEGKKNAQYAAMVLQTQKALNNWTAVHNALPMARKNQALPSSLLDEADNQAHYELLRSASDKMQTWRQLPKAQQHRAQNIALYCEDLMRKGDSAAAEKLLRSALKADYSDELVALYGKLEMDKPAKLRRQVDGWLNARPESVELNIAAGRLALRQKDSEAASKYLERAVELGQDPRAYAMLGEIYEAANQSGEALALYRSGMNAMAGQTAIQPVLTPPSEEQET